MAEVGAGFVASPGSAVQKSVVKVSLITTVVAVAKSRPCELLMRVSVLHGVARLVPPTASGSVGSQRLLRTG